MGRPRKQVIDWKWQEPTLFTLFGITLATMPQLIVGVVLLVGAIIIIKLVSLGRL